MATARNFPVKLAAGLLKHAAKSAIGDDTLDVVAEELIDASEEGAIGELDKWLNQPATERQLVRAIERADELFMTDTEVPLRVREAFAQIDLEREPALHAAINRLPRTADEAEMRAALVNILRSNYLPPQISSADVKKGVDVYLRCLRQGLLTLKNIAEPIVYKAVLVIERQLELLREIDQRTRRMEDAIKELADSVRRYAPNYGTRVDWYLMQYLGTTEQPAPFGGREAEMAALDRWLRDEGGLPYALIAAPAGRGKSALLVHWAKRVQEKGWAHVVLVPVSLGAETADELATYYMLAARLGEIYGEPPKYTDRPAREWQRLYLDFLRKGPPDGKQVVIILDGLDEATGRQASPHLLPSEPPKGVRAVVSARLRAGDVDGSGWLRRLGWERPGLAKRLPLELLTKEGVADVLREMGTPLDQLATKVDTTYQLWWLSEGEPLLVRLYVEALVTVGDRVPFLRPEDLPGIKRGLRGYFDKWWEDQTVQWAAQGRDPLAEKVGVQVFLNLLATALGPLGVDDVRALANREFRTGHAVTNVAFDVGRFVIGGVTGDLNEVGYSFSHPRLTEYFWDAMRKREQKEWEQKFRAYGRETLEALNVGRIRPTDAPAYVLRHYGSHLELREELLEVGIEQKYALVSEGWMRAWYEEEGGYSGFLRDVELAWRAAEENDHVAMQVKCALCRASVAAMSTRVPRELLKELLRAGFLTPRQGLLLVRQTADEFIKVGYVAELAPHLPEALLVEALDAAMRIGDKGARVKALAMLAPRFPQAQQEAVLGKALDAATGIRDRYEQVKALGILAPQLPDGLLADALDAAKSIGDGGTDARVRALVALVPHVSEEQRGALLADALETARAIGDEQTRTQALRCLAPHLPEALVADALEAARAVGDEVEQSIWDDWQPVVGLRETQAWFLRELVPHLREAHQEAVLDEALKAVGAMEARAIWRRPQLNVMEMLAPIIPEALMAEALDVARAIWDPWQRARVLEALVPHLPEALLSDALETARVIGKHEARARVLEALVPHLPEAQKEAVVGEALDAVRAIGYERERCRMLEALAPHLPESLMADALGAARALEDEKSRAEALRALAPHLPEAQKEGVLGEALDAARAIRDEDTRARVLLELAPYLPEALGEARKAASAIRDEWAQARALSALASYLPEAQKEGVLGEWLDAARAIGDEGTRARVLLELAPHLPEALLADALDAARAVEDEKSRAEALGALAPHLPEVERVKVLAEAIGAARAISHEWAQARVLGSLAPHLPEELQAEALNAARAIRGEEGRPLALGRLALHLPVAQQEAVLREALDAAQWIEFGPIRVRILEALARHLSNAQQAAVLGKALEAVRLPERQQEAALGEALDAARAIGPEGTRARVLGALAPHLPDAQQETVLDEALDAARAIGPEGTRARVLAALAQHSPEAERLEVLAEALDAARAINNKGARAEALSALAPHLPETERAKVLAEALGAARAIWDEWDRAVLLGSLAPHLPETLLGDALDAAMAIDYERDRAKALSVLAPHLPQTLLAGALDAAMAIGDTGDRAWVLEALVDTPVWASRRRPSWTLTWWKTYLREVSILSRSDVLSDLGALAPLILGMLPAEGRDEEALNLARAVGDVCRWWS